jgi:hypothetical protein
VVTELYECVVCAVKQVKKVYCTDLVFEEWRSLSSLHFSLAPRL